MTACRALVAILLCAASSLTVGSEVDPPGATATHGGPDGDPIRAPPSPAGRGAPAIQTADDRRPACRSERGIALALTRIVGTMWCAYAFAVLALFALPQAISGGLLPIVQWISQTFIQLVMLSVIMVGQNVLGQASDKRAVMAYADAEATLHEADQIQAHLTLRIRRSTPAAPPPEGIGRDWEQPRAHEIHSGGSVALATDLSLVTIGAHNQVTTREAWRRT